MVGQCIPSLFVSTNKPSNIDDGTLSRASLPAPGISDSIENASVIPGLGYITCLNRVADIMVHQTRRYLRTAADDGNYETSNRGLQFITEDRADAFGHCYMGCKGTRTCGESATLILGEGREHFVELLRFTGRQHNSYSEDLFNQRLGRELALRNPSAHCFDLCYRATVNGLVKLHGHSSSTDINDVTVYVCSDITIEGHEYLHGWRQVSSIHSHTGNLAY